MTNKIQELKAQVLPQSADIEELQWLMLGLRKE